MGGTQERDGRKRQKEQRASRRTGPDEGRQHELVWRGQRSGCRTYEGGRDGPKVRHESTITLIKLNSGGGEDHSPWSRRNRDPNVKVCVCLYVC